MKLKNKIKFALFFFFVINFSSCVTNIEEVNKITSNNKMPELSAKQIEILYSKSGEIEIKLYAPVLKKFLDKEEPYTEFPKGLTALFFKENHKIRSSFTAKYVKYLDEKKLWEAHHNVEIINENGDVLNTELLYADEKMNRIYTDKFVQITSYNGTVVKGEGGFESDINFTRYTFKKVEGVLNLEND